MDVDVVVVVVNVDVNATEDGWHVYRPREGKQEAAREREREREQSDKRPMKAQFCGCRLGCGCRRLEVDGGRGDAPSLRAFHVPQPAQNFSWLVDVR